MVVGAAMTGSGMPTTGAAAGGGAVQGGADEPESKIHPEPERPAFMRPPFKVIRFREQLLRVDVAKLAAPPARHDCHD